MRYKVYSFKNKPLNAYSNPTCENFEPEDYLEAIRRSIYVKKDMQYQNAELYLLGTFDDTCGKFDLLEEKLYIQDLDSIYRELFPSQESKKEDK